MQTILQTIWKDIYNDIGLLGIIIILTLYAMAADRGWAPKFWLGKKNGRNLNIALTNHIPHIEEDLREIKTNMKDMKLELHEQIQEVKKSAHARMDRMEDRMK